MTEERKLTFKGVELQRDAWERLTQAISVIGKAKPHHRTTRARKKSHAKVRGTGDAKAKA
jgi:hypothetical protein